MHGSNASELIGIHTKDSEGEGDGKLRGDDREGIILDLLYRVDHGDSKRGVSVPESEYERGR